MTLGGQALIDHLGVVVPVTNLEDTLDRHTEFPFTGRQDTSSTIGYGRSGFTTLDESGKETVQHLGLLPASCVQIPGSTRARLDLLELLVIPD